MRTHVLNDKMRGQKVLKTRVSIWEKSMNANLQMTLLVNKFTNVPTAKLSNQVSQGIASWLGTNDDSI